MDTRWAPDRSRQVQWPNPKNRQVKQVKLLDAKGTLLSKIECNFVTNARWSPDGQRVAIADYSAGVCRVVDASKPEWGPKEQLLVVHDELGHCVRDMAWSPDGARLAVGTQQGQFIVVDAATGAQVVKTEPTGHPMMALQWAPDSLRLAVNAKSTSVLDATTGKQLLAIPFPTSWCSSVKAFDWSPDGKRLALGGHTGEDSDERFFTVDVLVVDGTTGAILVQVKGHGDGIVRWSPGGDLLAVGRFQPGSGRHDGCMCQITLINSGTGAVLTQWTHSDEVVDFHWSTDGTKLELGPKGDEGILDVPGM